MDRSFLFGYRQDTYATNLHVTAPDSHSHPPRRSQFLLKGRTAAVAFKRYDRREGRVWWCSRQGRNTVCSAPWVRAPGAVDNSSDANELPDATSQAKVSSPQSSMANGSLPQSGAGRAPDVATAVSAMVSLAPVGVKACSRVQCFGCRDEMSFFCPLSVSFFILHTLFLCISPCHVVIGHDSSPMLRDTKSKYS